MFNCKPQMTQSVIQVIQISNENLIYYVIDILILHLNFCDKFIARTCRFTKIEINFKFKNMWSIIFWVLYAVLFAGEWIWLAV